MALDAQAKGAIILWLVMIPGLFVVVLAFVLGILAYLGVI
jgi:hypothetical protein